MSATALPESGHEPGYPSLPFSLYFGALDQPHWSKVSDEPAKKRAAEDTRKVEKDRRMRQVAALHDALHHMKEAVNAAVSLDRNGMADEAAENLDRTTKKLVGRVNILVADMRVAAEAYRVQELAVCTPPTEPVPTASVPTPAEMAKTVQARRADLFAPGRAARSGR